MVSLRLPPKPPPRRRQPKVLPAPAPTTAPPQGLVPTDADVLDYDDIRLIGYERAFQPYPETDYYTMCKDRPVGPDAQRWYRGTALQRTAAVG